MTISARLSSPVTAPKPVLGCHAEYGLALLYHMGRYTALRAA